MQIVIEADEAWSLVSVITSHVIDKSGNLRARFHGLKFKNISLILYVNALSNDIH